MTSRRTFLKQVGAASVAFGAPAHLRYGRASAQDGEVKFMARGDQAIFNVFKKLNEEFQRTDPGVTVKIEEVPSDWHQKFQLQIASGDAPDCLFEDAGDIMTDVRAGALAPIDDLIAGDLQFDKANYFEMAFDGATYDGKIYGLPYDGGSYAMYYNKELFDAAGLEYPSPDEPLTYDQAVELGTKLTLDRDNNTPDSDDFNARRLKQIGFDPGPNDTWGGLWLFWWSMGVDIIDKDKKVHLTDPKAIEAAQMMVDLTAKHRITPGPRLQNDALNFLSGNMAMIYDGVWSSVRYREARFDWDVAPVIRIDKPVSTGRYSPLSITSSAKNPEGAWKWISYCCGEEGQKIVAELGQAVPPVRALAESDAFLNPDVKPEHKEVFVNGLGAETFRMPGDTYGVAFAGYPREWGDMFTPIWTKALRGDASVEDAFAEAEPKLQNLLDTGKTN